MRKIFLLILTILISSVLAAGNIKVIVRDANDKPIEGALVTIEYKQAYTDSAGIAVLNGVYDLGDVSMTVAKEGYIPYSAVFRAQDNMIINVLLYSSTVGYLRGIVYINDKNHPADRYIIEIYDAKTSEKVNTVVTDDQGRFSYPTNADRKCYIIVRGYDQKFEMTPLQDPTSDAITIIINTTPPTSPPPPKAIIASDMEFVPGFMVVHGRMAAQSDTEASYDVRKTIDAWYKISPERLGSVNDTLHAAFLGNFKTAKPEVVSGIGYIDIATDDAVDAKKGFVLLSVGGPQVNLFTRSLIAGLRVRFVEDPGSVDKWYILDTQNNFAFNSSNVGILTFLPNPSYLDSSVAERVRGGDKRIGTLIIAGNAREGTYAAALKFSEFMNGSPEGSQFLDNFDKILLWLYTGENIQIQPMTFVVEYVSPTSARVIGIIIG